MPNGNVRIIAMLRPVAAQACSLQLRIKNSDKFEAEKGLLKNYALISIKRYKITKDLHKKYCSCYA